MQVQHPGQGRTGPIRNVCENCGGGQWSHVTPGDQKVAFVTSITTPHGRLIDSDKGTAFDMYVCEGCDNVRLFPFRTEPAPWWR